MKIKVDANGNVVLENGLPVYIRDDGTEVAIDVAAMTKTIAARNLEAKNNRERAERAEESLKAFEGIEDPEAARKALSVVQSLDQKKLIDAGQVELLKAELNKTWQSKLDAMTGERDTARNELVAEKIGGAFSRSSFISKKLAIPPDIAQAAFGQQFKLEDGRVVAYGKDGQRVLSKSNPGEVADFEEALSILVDAYPNKDSILKPDQRPGGGSPNSGGGGGNPKVMKRTAFESLDPAKRMEFMKGGGQIED